MKVFLYFLSRFSGAFKFRANIADKICLKIIVYELPVNGDIIFKKNEYMYIVNLLSRYKK